MRKFLFSIILLSSLLSLASSMPNMVLLGINSTQGRTILGPFLTQNPTIDTQLNNVSTLPVNTSFSSLFNHIFANSSVYDQLIPNASIIVPFTWTHSLTQQDKKAILEQLFTQHLSMFYSIMVNDLYPSNETQCQQLLQAVLATNTTTYIDAILAPVTGTYFQGKRCVLIYTNYLYIVDTLKTNLTYQQKLGLVPTLLRMNIIHKLIFSIV